MRWLARLGLMAALSVLLLAVAACSQSEPRDIEGHWVAENFRLQGLKLPIGPNLHITPHSMNFGAGIPAVPLVGIEAHKDEITLKTEVGVDVVFAFESKDRIFFEVPLVGYRIYYQRDHRANAPAVAAAAPQAAPAPASASVTAPVEVTRKPAPAPAPQTASLVSPLVIGAPVAPVATVAKQSPAQVAYQVAVDALRRGQDDTALRSLALAFQAGFVDWERLDQEPLFERLQGDVRFQVMQQRWRK